MAMPTNPILSYARSRQSAAFGDQRLEKRGAQLYEALSQHRTTSIRAISRDRAEQMGDYRWLGNDEVTLDEVIESLRVDCQGHLEGRHVLAISDSSEINLQAHQGRLQPEGVGVVGNNHDVGFFIHPTLVVESETGLPLGLSTVQVWHRPAERASKAERHYKRQPIEAKESYKWIKSAQGSEAVFEAGGVAQVTYMGDSESDIYEPWFQMPQTNRHLLVRACRDRLLSDCEASLFEHLAAQPVLGTYTIDLLADPRVHREARSATLSVRTTPVHLKRPTRLGEDYPAEVRVYAVEAVELNPPDGVEPVHWRLLTTHAVTTYEQAWSIIQWYRWRWHIEQLFAILKRRGLDIEASQLESVTALQKLTVLALSVALQVLQLTLGRDHPEAEATVVLNLQQQACLEQLAPSLNGRTRKQQNPHPRFSLAWAAWLIARLGGWSGYQSQRPPGIVTFYRGLQTFEGIFLGWKLAHP